MLHITGFRHVRLKTEWRQKACQPAMAFDYKHNPEDLACEAAALTGNAGPRHLRGPKASRGAYFRGRSLLRRIISDRPLHGTDGLVNVSFK